MSYTKYFILLFLSMVTSNVVDGQCQYYTLNGQIHVKNGETYPYQLLFCNKGNSIHGYSITKLAGGTEPKITIKGHIDREKKAMTISEKKLVSELPQNFSMCLVDAVLTYKSNATKYSLSGTFTSNDYDNKPCGKGTIEFEMSNAVEKLFSTDSPVHPKPAESEMPTVGPGEYEITNGVTKQFDWRSDTCTLGIYDGGVIDGDEVSVIFNGKYILTNYILAKQKKQIKLPLKKKLNTITIVAEYEGKVPPNTANIILADGNRQYQIKAFNNAGEKSTITINRK